MRFLLSLKCRAEPDRRTKRERDSSTAVINDCSLSNESNGVWRRVPLWTQRDGEEMCITFGFVSAEKRTVIQRFCLL